MIKYLSLVVVVTIMAVSNSVAQSVGEDASSRVSPGVSQKFILSDMSSIGVDTFNASGVKMKGYRHELYALYQPISVCPSDKGVACVAVMPPPPREKAVIFREWELANTTIKARVFNTCRRTIERAQPGSRVRIEGRVTESATGDRVFVRAITSCSVGTEPQ